MIKKILLYLVAIIVLLVLGLVVYVQMSWNKTYDMPGPALQASTDSAVIAKGKYLVEGPAHCVSCHVSSFDEFVKADKGEHVDLKGGMRFPMGPLGAMYSRNLTSDKETGLGRYSDEKVFRMLRHGIRPNDMAGMPLMMPFWNMADEDLVAIVSYLRSLPPVHNPVPENEWTFVGKAVRALTPTFKPIENPTPPKSSPAMAPTVERGEYLAKYVANCVGCHTQRDMMTYEAIGPEFAGGMEFEPWPDLHRFLGVDTTLWLRTPNLTPHPNSTLSRFKSADEFIKRIRAGRAISFSPMDWGPFSRMSDEDITALYMFLKSVPAVDKDIEVTFKKEEH